MSKACSFLWSHISLRINGAVIPCCRVHEFEKAENIPRIEDGLENAMNSEFFENYRNHMLTEDELPETCKRCALEEAAGYDSMRLIWNKRWGKYIGTEPKIRYIETSFSSHCNLACRMCNETYSSKWKLINNPGIRPELLMEPSKMDYYRNADLSHLDYVKVLGGEPFLTKEHDEFLDTITSQSNSSNIDLQYHTNGTIFPAPHIIEHWKKYKSVFICFSIDHVGDKNDWLRPGSSWEKLQNTVNKYIELKKELPNLVLGNNSVINSINVWEMDTLIYWLSQHIDMDRSYFDILRFPEHLSISSLTDELKNKVSDAWDIQENKLISIVPEKSVIVKQFGNAIRMRLAETPETRYTFEDIAKEEQKLDKYFKQDIYKIYPELFKIAKENEKND